MEREVKSTPTLRLTHIINVPSHWSHGEKKKKKNVVMKRRDNMVETMIWNRLNPCTKIRPSTSSSDCDCHCTLVCGFVLEYYNTYKWHKYPNGSKPLLVNLCVRSSNWGWKMLVVWSGFCLAGMSAIKCGVLKMMGLMFLIWNFRNWICA